jgi:hypothetical protein
MREIHSPDGFPEWNWAESLRTRRRIQNEVGRPGAIQSHLREFEEHNIHAGT